LNKYISNFLEQVCGEIKYKSILGDISTELKYHIYELMDGYIDNGLDENEAVLKAVEQMGDPIQIGKELDKTHRPKTEWSIIALIGVLVLIGGIALFSIASDKASLLNYEEIIKSYLAYVLVGIGVCTACYFFDYTKLEKYSLHIFIATICFIFVITKLGYRINGIPHIRIGGFSFSPVTISLPLFLISFSGLAKSWATGSIKNMLKLLGLAFFAVLIFMAQPSFASAVLLSSGFLIIITIAIMSKGFNGNKKGFLFSIYGGGILVSLLSLVYIFLQSPYRVKRLLVFLNPNSDPNGVGYINTLLEKIQSTSKLLGKSDNLYFTYQGVDKIALPEANTDYIFTYIVSSFGWIVGIITIITVTLAVARMFLASRKVNHQYGKYLASSIVTVFTLQVVANILMNTGVFPILAFSLPFISYGGANFVINMAMIGLLLGVYRRKDLIIADEGISA